MGPAAAEGNANIFASTSTSHNYIIDFVTTDNVQGWGFIGDESDPTSPLCGPTGCGGMVYVVNHRDTWTNGTLLNDISGGYEIVHWVGGPSRGYFDDILTWPKKLTPGEYDLILDLNCTGYNGVWTKIPDLSGVGYITDPIWPFTVAWPSGPDISINKTAYTSVMSVM